MTEIGASDSQIRYDEGPTHLQTEVADIFHCQAPERSDGKRYLSLSGTGFPSLAHVTFGLCLNPQTTQQEAEALAESINKHCPTFWAAFYDRSLSDEYFELNEHGLVNLDQFEYAPNVEPFVLPTND